MTVVNILHSTFSFNAYPVENSFGDSIPGNNKNVKKAMGMPTALEVSL